jgi:DNA invertase Pin-like site-specific DNA recombinase
MTVKTKPLRAAIYARVSTTDQTCENQLRDLRAAAEAQGWPVVAEYVEAGVSGAKSRAERPKLDAMLQAVAQKRVDMVMAWSVDRLGRSMIDLMHTLQSVREKGAGMYLHQNKLDTTTKDGRAMFGMLGIFAEYEREVIQERVRAGMARAKANPTPGKLAIGRPKVDPEVERRIVALRKQGMGMVKVAREVGCGVSTVQRVDAAAAEA